MYYTSHSVDNESCKNKGVTTFRKSTTECETQCETEGKIFMLKLIIKIIVIIGGVGVIIVAYNCRWLVGHLTHLQHAFQLPL